MNFLFILLFKSIFAADFFLTTEDGQKSKLFSTEVKETKYLTLSHVSKNILSLKFDFKIRTFIYAVNPPLSDFSWPKNSSRNRVFLQGFFPKLNIEKLIRDFLKQNPNFQIPSSLERPDFFLGSGLLSPGFGIFLNFGIFIPGIFEKSSGFLSPGFGIFYLRDIPTKSHLWLGIVKINSWATSMTQNGNFEMKRRF